MLSSRSARVAGGGPAARSWQRDGSRWLEAPARSGTTERDRRSDTGPCGTASSRAFERASGRIEECDGQRHERVLHPEAAPRRLREDEEHPVLRCLRPSHEPVARCDGVRAISGRNGIPSRRSPTVDPPDAPTAPAQARAPSARTTMLADGSLTPQRVGARCSGAETKTSSEVRSGDDGDADPLNRVVHVATEVPHRVERLLVPRGVAGAAAELVLPRSGVPPESPRTPGPPTERAGGSRGHRATCARRRSTRQRL